MATTARGCATCCCAISSASCAARGTRASAARNAERSPRATASRARRRRPSPTSDSWATAAFVISSAAGADDLRRAAVDDELRRRQDLAVRRLAGQRVGLLLAGGDLARLVVELPTDEGARRLRDLPGEAARGRHHGLVVELVVDQRRAARRHAVRGAVAAGVQV